MDDRRLEELAAAPDTELPQFGETVTVEARCIPGRIYSASAQTRREALGSILTQAGEDLRNCQETILNYTRARNTLVEFLATVETKLGKEP